MSRPALASVAACMALVAAPRVLPAQADTLPDEVNRALDRARPALLAHLSQSDQPINHGFTRVHSPGLLGLLCFAALHDGVPATDPGLAPALQSLSRAIPEATYDLALRLMVLEACPTFADRDKLARRDADELLRCRSESMFTYNASHGRPDLSNTQYGALGLRAAMAMGVKIEPRVWQDLLAAVAGMQDFEGGFGYSGSNRQGSYPSMTVAGIAVLQICREALEQSGHKVPRVAAMVKKGWRWMDKHAMAVGAELTQSCYYFHYGLERAAILSDVTAVGSKDWYRSGARMMVLDQLPGGGFESESDLGAGVRRGDAGDPVVTSFAVLFLSRAFRKLPGPVTPGADPTLAALDERSTLADLRAVADALVRRGRSALAEVLKALRSEVKERRRAAAMALRPLCGDDFGYLAELDPEQNCTALRRAELWYLRNKDAERK
jgi:hypothetical protein